MKSTYIIIIVVVGIILTIAFTPKIICEMRGGRWYKWSFWQRYPGCDLPYSDGGKNCNDLSDCESELCLYTGENPIVNASASGECAKWKSTSCVNHHYFIKNGKIVEQICVE